MSEQKSKAEIIAERQANLPLPEDPPVASDWNSADARTVNVAAGERQSEISTGDASSTGLREPATAGSGVNDPHSIIKESAGPVASDSLAAESDTFSENRNSEPQSVSGSNSTFANTNTSGVIRLDPASDAESRQAQENWASERSYPDALGGQSKRTAVENTQGSYQTGGSSSNAGTAPSYVNSQYVDAGGPKGKNLTEGGFDENAKNASFNQDIGGKNDPGRLAEQKFERENADAAGTAGMPKQQGVSGDNTYDTLGGDTSA
ncbi:uncharacterized protein LY89DRAFT_733063 [Mollisia scopiformis]|uniref:Uncharacterized protein n=1 Tax=Mollisia scopiformis TaxID=149040 RepID=A0A194XF47_MOLSC|nr:uncharacterized protein LY89DRAFT_733063 [Mollisia scopiformis]KUJ18392.1 hypothetical protein LY89DRAFT_733063 [Mollisia scopiformis]